MSSKSKKSFIFSIVGGATCILGGLNLLGLQARGSDSLIEALAHGIGIYCIGKGIYMIAMLFQLKELTHSSSLSDATKVETIS